MAHAFFEPGHDLHGEDESLIRAVNGLADVYERDGMGADEDCVRLTISQARRLTRLASAGLAKR